MDVLNNIWSFLTTENEMLTTIIISPNVIIEDYLSFLLITYILKIDYHRHTAIKYVLLLSSVSLITKFLIPAPLNVCINYLMMFLIIKTIFKTDFLKTILCILTPFVVFALVGIFILKPILIIFNLSVEQAQHTPIYELLYLLLLYTFTFLLIKFIQTKNLNLNFKEDFNPNDKKIIFLNLIFGFLSLLVQLAITTFYTDTLPFIITFLSFVSLLAYFFISFYSLTKTMKLQITTRDLENAENYNNTLSILYDNVKAFKHDFDNMIFILGGFIDNNDMDGLKKYYINLEKDCERVNNLALLNPNIINNAGIYNLLMAKYKKAADCNVEINLEFFFDFERLQMPIYEFSRILGILLDNAIEAASTSKEKQVDLIFRDSQHMHTQIITIKNTYSNKNLDLNKIFEKGITDKENHSGVGLWEVKQLEHRHNNIKLITDADGSYFKQQLEIYY